MAESAQEQREDTSMISDRRLQMVMHDLLNEVVERTERAPRTLAGMTLDNVQEASAALMELQSASIRLTQPEDWVLFRSKDGAEICFLQDAGCERVRALWGIDFASVSLKRDVEDHQLPDGNFVAEVIVSGTCRLTGETIEEMGFRSSAGFFAKDWESATKDESAVEIARMKANIRKSAIANGRGRCVRTITGLAQIPKQRLSDCGLDVRRIRGGARFESGTKGGSGDYASEPQLKALTAEAIKKVIGLDKVGDYGAILGKLSGAKITKARASQLIDGFKNMTDESTPVDVKTFQKQTGATFVEKGEE